MCVKFLGGAKIIILVVLVGLLAIYHHAVTTTVSSITSSLADKTDVLTSVPPYVPDDDGASKKALARHKFEDAWEIIRSELLAHFEEKRMPVDAQKWYKRVSPSTHCTPQLSYFH
jgi:farnesyl diphosphate synthase